jgi:hypothetical protein
MGHIVRTKNKRNGPDYRLIVRRYSIEQNTYKQFVVDRRTIIKFTLEKVCVCVCVDVWNHSRWLIIEFIIRFCDQNKLHSYTTKAGNI